MKNILKILLSFFAFCLFTFAVIQPLNMAGNWYQQFLPNIGGRTVNDISFTDSLTGYAVTTISSGSSYILKTINSGDNWSINHSVNFIIKRVQFLNPNTGYVGGSGLIKTTNGGANWFDVNLSMVSEDIHFINNDTGWYAYSEGLTGGVFRTINGGVNWTQQLNIGSQNPNRIYMFNARIGFITEEGGGTRYVRKTTDGGQSWVQVLLNDDFRKIYFIDSLNGWKCSVFGMKKTTDGGLNWVTQVLPFGGIISVTGMLGFSNINKDTIWGVGGYVVYPNSQIRGMIYRTTNGGDNWLFQIPDTSIHIGQYNYMQFTNKRNGWAYTITNTGVHTMLGGDTEFLTGITQIAVSMPDKFMLFQNYPNPFNPTTNIKYQIVKSGNAKLVIFDITGKEITTLTDKIHSAGIYMADWDASKYSSGIYFYKLTVTSGKEVYTDTKKMMLIK